MNYLTIDLEDWYHANILNIPKGDWSQVNRRIVPNTHRLLDLFDENQVKATFFVLGYVAETEPELVREIVRRGHEVASHGYYHELVYSLTNEAFRKDVRTSKAIIEDVTGQCVRFYRAPSWSITIQQVDKLKILCEEGYHGDSSLQPFWTPLSGSLKIPVSPFYPSVDGETLPILEVPPTVLNIMGLRLPFLGGFYLRAVPLVLVRSALRLLNKRRAGVLYAHPWEIDGEQQDIGVKGLKAFIHLYRLSTTYTKIDHLLTRFNVQPIGKSLDNANYPTKILRAESGFGGK